MLNVKLLWLKFRAFRTKYATFFAYVLGIVALVIAFHSQQSQTNEIKSTATVAAAKASVAASKVIIADKKTSQLGKNQSNGVALTIKNCIAQRDFYAVTAQTQRKFAANDHGIATVLRTIPIPGMRAIGTLLDERSTIETTTGQAAEELSGNTCNLHFIPVR